MDEIRFEYSRGADGTRGLYLVTLGKPKGFRLLVKQGEHDLPQERLERLAVAMNDALAD